MVNLDYLGVCESCAVKLKKDGYLEVFEEPEWSYLLKDKKKGQILFFTTWKDYCRYIKNNVTDVAENDCKKSAVNQGDPKRNQAFSYGCWKKSPACLQPRLKDALLGTNNCGGMDDKDIDDICAIFKAGCSSLYLCIGFRGHERLDKEEGKKTCQAIDIYESQNDICGDPERLKAKIMEYAKRNDLAGVPFLITSSGCNLEYDYRVLERFCFPERNPDISWFDSLTALRKGRSDPGEATQSTLWKATKKYFDHMISQCRSIIEYNQGKIQDYMEAIRELNMENSEDSEDTEGSEASEDSEDEDK